MTFSGRVGAAAVLVVTLATTVGLFYYASQSRKDSVTTLQAKLQEMELQRLEEEKGKQAGVVAQEAAERFSQFVRPLQKRAEALAGSPILRGPHAKAGQRRAKEKAFLQAMRTDPAWASGCITNEAGEIIGATAAGLPKTLLATPEFKQASRQHAAVLHLVERKGADLRLQITMPCFSPDDDFLGVLQVEAALSAATLDRLIKKDAVLTLLGTQNGRRLTPVSSASFPNNLGALVGKNLQDMETYLVSLGNGFFKADWGGTHYIIGSAQTVIPDIRLFALLEVTGLQKLISTQGESENLFQDPILVGGLIGIAALGLVLMVLFGGSGGAGAKQLESRLAATLEATGEWEAVTPPPGKTWLKLTDAINKLIARANGVPIRHEDAGEAPDLQAVTRLSGELSEMRRVREQLELHNRELSEKIDELTAQAQAASAAPPSGESAAPPAAAAAVAWARNVSQIRIDAVVNMSDDLKATLTVIKNYISSILSAEEGKITDAQQEFLGVVINKSARLERQINDLLDLAHLEREASQLFLAPTDLTAMISDVILNTQPQADTKQVRLTQDVAPNLPQLRLDGDRFGQVLVNIIQYALRVTPVGGEVWSGISETADDVIIKIIDGGTPLTPEQAGEVFSTFHAQDSKAGPAFAGTGLRFPIIKAIVDAHGGSIMARGLADQGNEMVIVLPKKGAVETDAGDDRLHLAAQTVRGDEDKHDGGEAYNLESFMNRTPSPQETSPTVAETGENLDELLKSLDESDNPPER